MGNCEYCGGFSSFYKLCKKCNNLKEEGELLFCDDCETWYKSNEDCECEQSSECILCDADSNGYIFCKKCYNKYKKKKITIGVTNCTKFDLLSEEYTNAVQLRCDDGHQVRSKSEVLIDNFLFNNKIRHVYEKPLAISQNDNLHPDFYLPDYDIWIEHWGFDSSNKKYTETKDYKIPIYKKLGITMICTYEKDTHDIAANLDRKLRFCTRGQVNNLDE